MPPSVSRCAIPAMPRDERRARAARQLERMGLGPRRAQDAADAVRRRAPAGRDRPRACARPRHHPDGRAVLGARPQHAGAAAPAAGRAVAGNRQDHPVRDARRRRGADAGRSHRRAVAETGARRRRSTTVAAPRPRQIESDPALREARRALLALFATFESPMQWRLRHEKLDDRRPSPRPCWHARRSAQTTVTFGYLADPSHEAVMWALRNGKVKSDTVKIEATPLDISALIQATAARTYDVVQTAAVAVPRARERGLDLRIVGTGLRYHTSGRRRRHLGQQGQPAEVGQRPQGQEARRLFARLGRHHAHPHRARRRARLQRRGARRRRRIRRDAGAGPAGGARLRPHRCGDPDPRAGLQGAAERRVRRPDADRRGPDARNSACAWCRPCWPATARSSTPGRRSTGNSCASCTPPWTTR